MSERSSKPMRNAPSQSITDALLAFRLSRPDPHVLGPIMSSAEHYRTISVSDLITHIPDTGTKHTLSLSLIQPAEEINPAADRTTRVVRMISDLCRSFLE